MKMNGSGLAITTTFPTEKSGQLSYRKNLRKASKGKINQRPMSTTAIVVTNSL
jgi:hypothetical protein